MGRKKPSRKAESPSKRRISWPRWTGFRGKTVWDLLQLLIVPLMLAAIGFWFTTQQDARQQRVENQRAQAERELAEQRAQDEALQAYLDQMSTLLLEQDIRTSEEGSEVRTLAKARTLTALQRLDADRNRIILRFLREAKLIHGGRSVVSLTSADLEGVDLKGADLNSIDLEGADLSGADLTGANLSYTFLRSTHLERANLQGADLRGAVLTDAKVTDEQLAEAESLKGGTMPNGQKYEDWL